MSSKISSSALERRRRRRSRFQVSPISSSGTTPSSSSSSSSLVVGETTKHHQQHHHHSLDQSYYNSGARPPDTSFFDGGNSIPEEHPAGGRGQQAQTQRSFSSSKPSNEQGGGRNQQIDDFKRRRRKIVQSSSSNQKNDTSAASNDRNDNNNNTMRKASPLRTQQQMRQHAKLLTRAAASLEPTASSSSSRRERTSSSTTRKKKVVISNAPNIITSFDPMFPPMNQNNNNNEGGESNSFLSDNTSGSRGAASSLSNSKGGESSVRSSTSSNAGGGAAGRRRRRRNVVTTGNNNNLNLNLSSNKSTGSNNSASLSTLENNNHNSHNSKSTTTQRYTNNNMDTVAAAADDEFLGKNIIEKKKKSSSSRGRSLSRSERRNRLGNSKTRRQASSQQRQTQQHPQQDVDLSLFNEAQQTTTTRIYSPTSNNLMMNSSSPVGLEHKRQKSLNSTTSSASYSTATSNSPHYFDAFGLDQNKIDSEVSQWILDIDTNEPDIQRLGIEASANLQDSLSEQQKWGFQTNNNQNNQSFRSIASTSSQSLAAMTVNSEKSSEPDTSFFQADFSNRSSKQQQGHQQLEIKTDHDSYTGAAAAPVQQSKSKMRLAARLNRTHQQTRGLSLSSRSSSTTTASSMIPSPSSVSSFSQTQEGDKMMMKKKKNKSKVARIETKAFECVGQRANLKTPVVDHPSQQMQIKKTNPSSEIDSVRRKMKERIRKRNNRLNSQQQVQVQQQQQLQSLHVANNKSNDENDVEQEEVEVVRSMNETSEHDTLPSLSFFSAATNPPPDSSLQHSDNNVKTKSRGRSPSPHRLLPPPDSSSSSSVTSLKRKQHFRSKSVPTVPSERHNIIDTASIDWDDQSCPISFFKDLNKNDGSISSTNFTPNFFDTIVVKNPKSNDAVVKQQDDENNNDTPSPPPILSSSSTTETEISEMVKLKEEVNDNITSFFTDSQQGTASASNSSSSQSEGLLLERQDINDTVNDVNQVLDDEDSDHDDEVEAPMDENEEEIIQPEEKSNNPLLTIETSSDNNKKETMLSPVAALFANRALQLSSSLTVDVGAPDLEESSERSMNNTNNGSILRASKSLPDDLNTTGIDDSTALSRIRQQQEQKQTNNNLSSSTIGGGESSSDQNTSIQMKKEELFKSINTNMKEEKESDKEDKETSDEIILKEDPKYTKYFKMLKVGLPLDAVKHAMKRDGLDPAIMDLDPTKSLASQQKTSSSCSETQPPQEPQGPPLKEDPTYLKYFKMLKVGLPMGAVKHAMQRDGLDPTILDLDPNKPLPNKSTGASTNNNGASSSSSDSFGGTNNNNTSYSARANNNKSGNGSDGMSQKEKKTPKDTHRRTRVHWDTLQVNEKVQQNSVWHLLNEDPDLEQIIDIDEKEFKQLFQSEISTSNSSNNDGRKNGNGGASSLMGGGQKQNNGGAAGKLGLGGRRNVVKVIDPKRANNGGIILARIKVSYEDIAWAVDKLDDSVVNQHQLSGIEEYLPTKKEQASLEAFMSSSTTSTSDGGGGVDQLCECEKFMVAMMKVNHAKRKVQALIFKLQFMTCIDEVLSDANIIGQACEQLSRSVRFRKLLGVVLNIGNRLNTAGPSRSKGHAGAITLGSLLKLNQAKAFDKKTTFLHYVIAVVKRNNEQLLGFKEEIPSVLKADKIYWDQCLLDLEEAENQLENVRMIALHHARQIMPEWTRRRVRPRPLDDDCSLSDCSLTLEEEVSSLRSTPLGTFTLDAIKKVSALRDRVEKTQNTYRKLLEYFGENDKLEPHELFEIIVKFSRIFDTTLKEVEATERAKEQAKLREEKKRAQAAAASKEQAGGVATQLNKSRVNESQHSSSSSRIRVSSMQPNMGAVIKDIKRIGLSMLKPIAESKKEQQVQQSSSTSNPVYFCGSNNSLGQVGDTSISNNEGEKSTTTTNTRLDSLQKNRPLSRISREYTEKVDLNISNNNREDSNHNSQNYPDDMVKSQLNQSSDVSHSQHIAGGRGRSQSPMWHRPNAQHQSHYGESEMPPSHTSRGRTQSPMRQHSSHHQHDPLQQEEKSLQHHNLNSEEPHHIMHHSSRGRSTDPGRPPSRSSRGRSQSPMKHQQIPENPSYLQSQSYPQDRDRGRSIGPTSTRPHSRGAGRSQSPMRYPSNTGNRVERSPSPDMRHEIPQNSLYSQQESAESTMFNNRGGSPNPMRPPSTTRGRSQSPMRRHISLNPSFEQPQSYQNQMDSGESSMYDIREKFGSNAPQNNLGVNRERSQSPMLRHFTQSPSSHQYSQPSSNQTRPIMRSQSPMYDRERRRTEEDSIPARNSHHHHHEDPRMFGNRGISHNNTGRIQHDRRISQSPMRRHISQNPSFDQPQSYQNQMDSGESSMYDNRERFESNASHNTGVSRERSQSPMLRHFTQSPSSHQYSQPSSNQTRPIMRSQSPMYDRERRRTEEASPMRHNMQNEPYRYGRGMSPNTRGSRVQSDISRGRTQSPLRREYNTLHEHQYQSQSKNISQPFVSSRERSQSPTMQHYSSHQNSAPSHHQQYSQQDSRQMHSRSPMYGRHNDESPAPTHHNSHIHTYNNTNTASTNTKSHSHPYSGSSSNYNTHQSQTMGPPSVERGRSQSPSPYNTRSHERPPTSQSHAPSNVFPNNGNSTKQSGYTAMTSSQIMKRNERIRRHRNSIQRSSSITRSSSNPGVEDSRSHHQQQQRQVQSTPNTNTNNSSDIQYRRRVRDMLRRDHGHNHNAPSAHHSKQQQVEQQSRRRNNNRGHSQPRYNDTTSRRMMMRQNSSSNNNNSGRGVVGWPSGSGHQPGVRSSSRKRMDYDLEVD